MIWVGRDFKDHLIPNPAVAGTPSARPGWMWKQKLMFKTEHECIFVPCALFCFQRKQIGKKMLLRTLKHSTLAEVVITSSRHFYLWCCPYSCSVLWKWGVKSLRTGSCWSWMRQLHKYFLTEVRGNACFHRGRGIVVLRTENTANVC